MYAESTCQTKDFKVIIEQSEHSSSNRCTDVFWWKQIDSHPADNHQHVALHVDAYSERH